MDIAELAIGEIPRISSTPVNADTAVAGNCLLTGIRARGHGKGLAPRNLNQVGEQPPDGGGGCHGGDRRPHQGGLGLCHGGSHGGGAEDDACQQSAGELELVGKSLHGVTTRWTMAL